MNQLKHDRHNAALAMQMHDHGQLEMTDEQVERCREIMHNSYHPCDCGGRGYVKLGNGGAVCGCGAREVTIQTPEYTNLYIKVNETEA